MQVGYSQGGLMNFLDPDDRGIYIRGRGHRVVLENWLGLMFGVHAVSVAAITSQQIAVNVNVWCTC